MKNIKNMPKKKKIPTNVDIVLNFDNFSTPKLKAS